VVESNISGLVLPRNVLETRKRWRAAMMNGVLDRVNVRKRRIKLIILAAILIVIILGAFVWQDREEEQKKAPSFLLAWGSQGFGLGQFNYPAGVAVDSSGNVYVADTGNNRVQKFGSVSTISVEQVVLIIAIAIIVVSIGAYLTMRKHPKNLRRTIFNLAVTKFERNRFLFLASAVAFAFAAASIFWNFQRMGLSHWDEYYYIGTAAWIMNIDWGRFQSVEPTLFPFLLARLSLNFLSPQDSMVMNL